MNCITTLALIYSFLPRLWVRVRGGGKRVSSIIINRHTGTKYQAGLQRNQSGHPAENGPDWMGNRNNNLANGFTEGLPLSRKMFNHS